MITQINSGFSIEFEYGDNDLMLDGNYDGLPLYKVLGGKITAIAIVEKPANKTKCVINDSDRTINGVVLIPNQKIYRTEPVKCYWYFPKETISLLQKKYKNQKIKIGH